MHMKKLPREQKEWMMEKVQQYMAEELQEDLGNIAAEGMVEFMLKELGPYVYNQAVKDARDMLMAKMTSMEEDLYAMEQPMSMSRRSADQN